MSDADKIVRAGEYLAMVEADDPDSLAGFPADEFLREYLDNPCTLDEAFSRTRARKNQREAILRKKLRN